MRMHHRRAWPVSPEPLPGQAREEDASGLDVSPPSAQGSYWSCCSARRNQGFKSCVMPRRPDPHHRPEPSVALRPAGMAGVPGPQVRWLPVAAVCPKGKGDPSYQVVDGIELYKYRPYAPGGSKISFIAEYAYSFLATAAADAPRPGRTAGSRSSRPAIRQISSGPSPCSSARSTAPSSSSITTTCARNCTSPAFPSGPRLPYRGLRALERRTHRVRRPRDLHQRLLP